MEIQKRIKFSMLAFSMLMLPRICFHLENFLQVFKYNLFKDSWVFSISNCFDCVRSFSFKNSLNFNWVEIHFLDFARC